MLSKYLDRGLLVGAKYDRVGQTPTSLVKQPRTVLVPFSFEIAAEVLYSRLMSTGLR